MCFGLFSNKVYKNSMGILQERLLNKEIECYIIISDNFCKPYGIYSNLNLAENEYRKLTNRLVNASIYKVRINDNIVDSKEFYTLIRCNNMLHF